MAYANGLFGSVNTGDMDYELRRQQWEYQRAMAMNQQAALGGLANALGMQQQEQAVRAAPPKQDPQPNPVLLLTGEDE